MFLCLYARFRARITRKLRRFCVILWWTGKLIDICIFSRHSSNLMTVNRYDTVETELQQSCSQSMIKAYCLKAVSSNTSQNEEKPMRHCFRWFLYHIKWSGPQRTRTGYVKIVPRKLKEKASESSLRQEEYCSRKWDVFMIKHSIFDKEQNLYT